MGHVSNRSTAAFIRKVWAIPFDVPDINPELGLTPTDVFLRDRRDRARQLLKIAGRTPKEFRSAAQSYAKRLLAASCVALRETTDDSVNRVIIIEQAGKRAARAAKKLIGAERRQVFVRLVYEALAKPECQIGSLLIALGAMTCLAYKAADRSTSLDV